MNRRKILQIAILLIVAVAIVQSKCVVKAGTYDDAFSYYQSYSNSLVRYYRGKLYFGNRAHKAVSYSPYKFDGRGRRFSVMIGNHKYFIDIKLSEYGGSYDHLVSRKVVQGYQYNLYAIDYGTLCELLEYRYPNADLAALYDQSCTVKITIDAIMAIKKRQKNGTYKLLGDITSSYKGRIVTFGTVYRSETAMSNGWRYYTGGNIDFNGFYNISISVPANDKPQFLEVTSVLFSGDKSAYYQIGPSSYYIRANKDFKLTYKSVSTFATSSCQSNRSYWDTINMKTGQVITSDSYIYTKNNKNGGVIYGGDKANLQFHSPTAVRSNGNKTLQVSIQLKVLKDGLNCKVYPRAQVVEEIKGQQKIQITTKQFPKGKEIQVISDGEGPQIKDNSDKTPQEGSLTLNFNVWDSGVGVAQVDLKDSTGKIIATSKSNKLAYRATEGGMYYVVSKDLVGNTTTYKKNITIPKDEVVEIRFINPQYAFLPQEQGGVRKRSAWRKLENWSYLKKAMSLL